MPATGEENPNPFTSETIRIIGSTETKEITPAEVRDFVRPHHILSIYQVLIREGLEEVYWRSGDKGLAQIASLLFVEAETNYSDDELREIANRAANQAVKRALAGVTDTGWQSDQIKYSEYVGEHGEFSEEYTHLLSEYFFKIMKTPKGSKFELRFEPDEMCYISQGGQGPVAHCKEKEVGTEDVMVWYAVNDVVSRNQEYKDLAGLVKFNDNHHSVWLDISLLRNKKFLSQVNEKFRMLYQIKTTQK